MNHLFVFTLMLALSWGGLVGAAVSDVPHAVTLRYFRATLGEDGVLLEWATASEVTTVGFRIERSAASTGPFERLDAIGFVAAQGDSLGGGEYDALDATITPGGQTLWYRVLEVESDGTENPSTPISVTLLGSQTSPTITTQETTATGSPASNFSAGAQTSTPGPATVTLNPAATGTDFRSVTGQGLATPVTSAPAAYPQPASSDSVFAAGAGESIAQVSSPTPAEGYPVPPVGTPPPTEPGLDTGAYPGLSPEAALTQPAAPGPAAGSGTLLPPDEPSGTEPPAIGSNGNGNPSADEVESVESQSAGTTIFLWLGFIASLLIFAGGVYGSIVLFTRHRTRGR